MRFKFDSLVVVFKYAFLIFILGVIALRTDLDEFSQSIESVGIRLLAYYLVLNLVIRVILSFRFSRIIVKIVPDKPISTLTCFRVNVFAEMVSIIFPSTTGIEGARGLALIKMGMSVVSASQAILVDRIVGLIVILFFTLVGAPVISELLLEWSYARSILNIDAGVISSIIFVFFLCLVVFLYLKYSENIRDYIKPIFLFLSPIRSFDLFVLSVIAHMVGVLSYFVIINAFMELSSVYALVMYTISNLARLIPISVFGIGGGEVIFGILLDLVGVSFESALVIVSITLIVRYIVASAGAIFELFVGSTKSYYQMMDRQKGITSSEKSR